MKTTNRGPTTGSDRPRSRPRDRRVARAAPVVALAVAGACADGRPADLLLTGGRVYTVDAQREWAEAVAVRDGRIVYVGDAAGAEAWAGEATRRIDLGGRTLLPGFVDAHVHPISGYELDLATARTPAQVFTRVAEYAAARPDEAWVEGYGWDLTIFPPAGPRVEWLDSLVPDRPAMIWGGDGHSIWVNSRALEAAGIGSATADPEGGRIERRPDGSPAGTLRETAATLVENAAPVWSLEKRLRALDRSLAMMREYGVTAFLEASVDDDAMLDVYREASRRGMLTAHAAVSLAVAREGADLDIDSVVTAFRSMRDSDTFPDLDVGTAKIFVDGVIEAGTAAMLEPYTGTEDDRGNLLRPPAVLNPLVRRLHEAGFQLHFHAIGDGGIRATLDAIEAAGIDAATDAEGGTGPGRPLIAHAQLVDPADLSRFARLGAIPVFSAVWAYEDAYIRDLTVPRLGPERSERIYPMHSLHASGARLALGSDWPVTTMNPLEAIEVAVTRVDPGAPAGSAPPFLPDERIDLATAIEAATLGSAYALRREHESGSIEVGKRADLILLSEDPFEAEPQRLSEIQVLLTLYGGREVFRHASFR